MNGDTQPIVMALRDKMCACGGLQFRLVSDGTIKCVQCKQALPGARWGFVESDTYNADIKKPGA